MLQPLLWSRYTVYSPGWSNTDAEGDTVSALCDGMRFHRDWGMCLQHLVIIGAQAAGLLLKLRGL
jgi:hypothetical protein